MANLPLAGVELVAKNAAGFNKAMEQANKSLGSFTDATQNTAKQATQSNKGILDFAGSVKGLINPVTIAATAVAALGKAFIDLGTRGARVVDIADSFRRLSGEAGVLANVLLKDLRTAARGTVSDFELMQRANLALAGTTGLFRTQFLEGMPKLLEIARVQARATGQSVDYLYESLITGIKRTSPLLIDNTGIVLKVGEANAKYAAELGKTVEQLTVEERQTALLNATLEAGAVAVEKLGTANLTATEKVAAIGVTIQNAFDRVAVAIQPLWDLVTGVLLDIVTVIGDFISNELAPAIHDVARFIAELIQFIAPAVRAIWGFIQPVFQRIADAIGFLVKLIQPQLEAFFRGGFFLIGALAGGIQRAYTELVQPLIIAIAEFIASFLSGESPPPEGPLSDIDQGGKNTMLAWLEGFASAPLDSVEEVTAQVAEMMGDVANMSLVAVQTRIAQLDAQLKPFSDRVDILKARFDALNEPAELAFEAIERQMAKAEEALAAGDTQAAETLRRLDAQKEALQRVVGAEQDVLDNAQIQLALVRAQQQEERTLLEIRKASLPVQEAAAKTVEKVAKSRKTKGTGKVPTEKKGTGKAEPLPTPAPGGVALPEDVIMAQDLEGLAPTEEEAFGIGEFVSENLVDGWLAGMGGTDAATKFQEGQDRLNAAMEKIGGSTLVQKLTDAFADVPTAIQDNLITPIQDAVDNIINFFTGTEEGTLGWAFSSISANLPGWLQDVEPILQTSALDVISKFIGNAGDFLLGTGEGTLGNVFSSIGDNVGTWIGNAKTWFEDNIGVYIWGEGSFLSRVSAWLTDTATEGGLANILTNLGTNISTWLQTAANALIENPLVKTLLSGFQSIVNFLFGTEMTAEGGHTLYTAIQALVSEFPTWLEGAITALDENFIQPIIGEDGILGPVIDFFFNSEKEGTLAYTLATLFGGDAATPGSIANFIQQGIDFLTSIPNMIIQALKDLALALWNSIAVPFINVANHVIDVVNSFIKTINQAMVDGLNAIGGLVGAALFSAPQVGEIPKISKEPPSWLTGAAQGGVFTKGLLRVGEQGEELIASASKMAVFPNRMVNAMDNLASVMAQPVPMPVSAGYGGDTYDNSRSLTINGGFGSDASDERRLLAHLMAFFEGF